MGQRNRHPLTTSLVLFSSMAGFGQVGSAKAQSTTETAKPTEEAPKAEPTTTGEADKAAAPASEAPAQPTPATPTCNCPPPCPVPPPPPPAPAAPAVEWKVQSKGGMLITSGNAQSKNFTVGVNGFRKEGNNKLSLEGGLAYGTSDVLTARTNNGTTTVDREQITSTNNMAAKGRYDRFLTEHNTIYASGQAAADKIAGKTFFGGGQIGYSRLLVEDNWNLVVAELGYDFSYERYVQPADSTTPLDPVAIHSARVLVGETLSLSKETGITASVEALFNLNKETKAIDVSTGNPGVNAFKDTRVNAKVGLGTNLWKSLSFGFSFALKYDQNPAPRPVPKAAPASFSFAKDDPNYYSDKVDTITEATLLYTFF